MTSTAVEGAMSAAVRHVLRRMPDLPGDLAELKVRPLDGMTNTVFRVDCSAGSFSVRLPSETVDPWVDRRAEAANARAAAAAGLGPRVLFSDPEDGSLVCRFLPGGPLTVENARTPQMLARVGAMLRRLHSSGIDFVNDFDPFVVLAQYEATLRRNGCPDLLPEAALLLRVRLTQIQETLRAHPAPPVACHHDLWPPNIVATEDELALVDWEYAGRGDPLWDLADFSVATELNDEQERILLDAWWGTPVPGPLHARLRLYKPVCDALWAWWAVVQHAGHDHKTSMLAYAEARARRGLRAVHAQDLPAALRTVDRGAPLSVGGADRRTPA